MPASSLFGMIILICSSHLFILYGFGTEPVVMGRLKMNKSFSAKIGRPSLRKLAPSKPDDLFTL